MKKNIVTYLILLFFTSQMVSAQVAMGKWRTHFAYNNVAQIAQSPSKIYAVSDGALFSVDKLEGESGIEFYSKLSGLNGSSISRIEFDQVSQQLLIVYTNGNIDLMTSGGVVNIPDLYNKQMSTSKDINQITFYNGKGYLACNFGIIALNMQRREVADTYYIGPNASEVKVLGVTVNKGSIYALSSSVIYTGNVSETHLVNYQYWSAMTGLPGSGDFQNIGSFDGQLILQRGGKLYKQGNDKVWLPILSVVNVSSFNVTNESLNVFDGSAAYLLDKQYNVKTINNVGLLTDAEYDATNGTYWFAANALGVISIKNAGDSNPTTSYYKPAGPAVNIPWNMTFAGKKLFVVQGGRFAGQYNRDGIVMVFENGVWTNLYNKPIQDSIKNSVLDFENVAVDPNDNKHFFVTSWGTGLYEFANDKFTNWYNPSNSTITSVVQSAPYLYSRLDAVVFDKDKNLLLTNTSNGKYLEIRIRYNADGKWYKLSYPFSSLKQNEINTLGQLLISNQNPNQKWVTSVRTNPGVAVFDDNGTLTNQSDDKTVFFESMIYPETDNQGKTVLQTITPNYIFSMAQDKNGVVWVGTDMGPFLFQNLSKVFDSGYTCSRVKIPRNDSTNLADYLLVNERIKCIAVDGANRKWLGTEQSGVYLMSENGQQTIQHFTVSNSPLLSNDILSIAINPVTGEVFFGTGQGIVSYQSDAGEASATFGNVYAYPNPVREGFTGVITITGLVEKTQIKITDIGGNLVCQTVSNGSIATWDGKDAHGRKVNTGIYLALCTSEDGTQSAIAKILVVN
jgi:hypothetical protein